MSTPTDIDATLDKVYNALSTADVETWIAMHTADVTLNVAGYTAVSGRTLGAKNVWEKIIKIFSYRVNPGSKIDINWKLMCVDDKRAVVIFEGDRKNVQGKEYNSRYCHILEFDADGLIQEIWGFFDTALSYNVNFKDKPSGSAGNLIFSY